MHLTDDEIFNYLTDKKEQNAHLKQCDMCQRRLENRASFRKRLSQSYQSNEFEMGWDLLEQQFEQSFHRRDQQKMESKIKKLQFGLISLAACLCLVVLVPLINSDNTVSNIDSKLASVIDENHQLQRSMELSSSYGNLQTVGVQALQIKLQQIDSEIQLSYLEGLTKLEKLKLWQARKQLLISSIDKLNTDLSKTTESI